MFALLHVRRFPSVLVSRHFFHRIADSGQFEAQLPEHSFHGSSERRLAHCILHVVSPRVARRLTSADFFHVDPDLVRASAERPADADGGAISDDAVREVIAAIPEAEKTALLQRLVDGDPHVAAEVRSRVREAAAPGAGERGERRRTVADLRARAAAIRKERETAAAGRCSVGGSSR